MKPLFVSVNGTGVPDPFGPGFSADIGRVISDPWNDIYAQFMGPQVANKYDWQPIGYPAATFPMGPSVDVGREEVVRQISMRPVGTRLALSGYSQGALVVDETWRDEFIKPSGRLHNRLDDVVAIVNFGDPMRCPGICNGNLRAGFPIPGELDGFTTGGISGPDDLKPEETPDFLMSCNNPGDLYGSAPVGDSPWTKQTGVGHDETMIFNLVQFFNGTNLLALTEEAMKALGVVFSGGLNITSLISVGESVIGGVLSDSVGIPGIPASGASTPNHVVSMVLALLNGGMFVLRGFGPHGDYAKMVPAMVDFVLSKA